MKRGSESRMGTFDAIAPPLMFHEPTTQWNSANTTNKARPVVLLPFDLHTLTFQHLATGITLPTKCSLDASSVIGPLSTQHKLERFEWLLTIIAHQTALMPSPSQRTGVLLCTKAFATARTKLCRGSIDCCYIVVVMV